MQAALTGSREIGFTIVSMTLSLAAVFIPILFMAGILGRLFREFAVTICTAILISGMVSVSLTPMLCSRFLRENKGEKHGFLYRAMEGVFDWTAAPLRHHAGLGAAPPPGHAGHVRRRAAGHGRPLHGGPQGLHSRHRQRQFLRQRRSRPGHLLLPDGQVSAADLFHRGAGSRRRELLLHHRRQLLRTVRRLRPHDGQHQAAPAAQGLGGRHRQPPASQTLQHPRPARFALRAAGHPRRRPHVQERLRFHAVRTGYPAALYAKRPNWSASSPACPACRMSSAICRSRRRASTSSSTATAPPPSHLNWNTISSTLYDAFGPQFASTIYAPTNQYRVLLEMLPKFQQHTDGLDMIYLKSDTGEMVPLKAVANTGDQCRSAEHSALRPVALGHHFVRAQARHLAGPGHRRYRGRRQDHSARPPSPAPSRAPPRSSRIPCATWASC